MKNRTVFFIVVVGFCVPDLFFFCRILGSCTSLMQAIQVLIVASKDLQREIVESGRVSMCKGLWTSVTDVQFTDRLGLLDVLVHIQ